MLGPGLDACDAMAHEYMLYHMSCVADVYVSRVIRRLRHYSGSLLAPDKRVAGCKVVVSCPAKVNRLLERVYLAAQAGPEER